MNEVRTDPRALVRVLLRGVGLSSIAAVRVIAGHRAFVVGAARAEAWPDVDVECGDVEAAVWTTARQAASVRRALAFEAQVVAVHGGDD